MQKSWWSQRLLDSFNRVCSAFRTHFAVVTLIALACSFIFSSLIVRTSDAVTGINRTINYQGRLFNNQGAAVADGYYNIQFKIYQDGDGTTAGNTTGSPAGTLKWTENYVNNNANQGVLVKNGFMSVNLGTNNPFGSQVDWNQSVLWVSMNIAGTSPTCTNFTSCTPDGEMLPMKQMTTSPYSMNSGALNGLTSSNFVQLAQGVQTDASTNTSSIFINKTSTGNLVQLQSGATDVFTIANNGDLTMGSNTDHTLSVAAATASTAGKGLTLGAGSGGTGTGSNGGTLTLQGGAAGGTNANGGNINLDAGAKSGTGTDGAINIGTARASTIQIGGTSIASGVQTINIGTNANSGSQTNVTIGSAQGSGGGTTTVQAKGNVVLSTNGTTRATFGNNNTLVLGNGGSSPVPNDFSIQGTTSSASSVTGGSLTVQGGGATIGNTNGGNVTLAGGTASGSGANGLVILTTPTLQTTANDANCYTGGAVVTTSCTITAASLNNNGAVIVGFNGSALTATLPTPPQMTAGRLVYVTAANGSSDFTLLVNGGGTGNQIAMRQNTTATMIWNGTAWTAAGASSSTTLQAAYDNTLQSAGGAELVVSKTSATNGLTIRDSATNSVNGTLLSVQTSSAAGLFSVNSNVTEYASDAGAEVAGGSATTFPSNTWINYGSGSTSRYTTAGNFINTGKASVAVSTTAANTGTANDLTTALNANMTYNVSFSARLASGTFTDMNVFYSVDGTTASTQCTTNQAVKTSTWTKVNCTFKTPASGITAANAILISQASAATRTFYVDNLSVTIAADFNYATDGGVDDPVNFTNNWSSAGLGSVAVSRSTTDGNDASDSAVAAISTGAVNAGIRNDLSVNPLPSTLYRVSVYAKSASGTFSDFKVRYSRDGSTTAGGNYVDCVDYNTQTISSSSWTQVTCYITTDGTAPTNPNVYFVEGSAVTRTFSVDTFSMTLAANTTPNVQIGGGVNGGPTTLLTLDKGASAPIAANNDALLGSMYYDTTLGKLQCYEADGWGACGSSPDNVVTISPEYTNAVLHGTGVGTMTSDFCSNSLGINDGSNSQSAICGTNETYNYYKWTSPQSTAQSYGIYVTYQLPSTFKAFGSGQTTIKGKTDSANSTVQYQVFRSNPTSGLSMCGSSVPVSTGTQTSWQVGTASGAADPSTCGFVPGDSIVFKINMTASLNANAYVSNLGFIFSNR